MSRTPPQRFPSFAGVALADILANSVAIVIIMIVVTLMVRHEQEREKLTQTEDVAVLLSRELASSFVMNALPTSPPAQLHDYVTSPLDRNPHHATMPIIELHRRFVRDHYTGRTYGRDELLRQDNAFDAYLRTLTQEQLAAMRMDIYSAGLFYVVMSILKAHGHAPRHWHFLGDGPGRGRHLASAGASAPRRDQPEAATEDNEGDDAAGPAGRMANDGRQADRLGAGAWPEDIALAPASGAGRYPRDGAAGAGGAWEADAELDLPGQIGSLESSAADAAGKGATVPGEESKRFRAAKPVSAAEARPLPLAFNMASVLRGLWVFMAAEQRTADAGLPSRLPRYDFERDVLGAAVAPPIADDPRAGTAPDPRADEREQALRGIVFLLQTPRAPAANALTLRVKTRSAVRGQALAFFPNEPVARTLWLRDANQPERASPVEAAVTLRLGLHAEVHEGVRVPLGRGSLVLTPYGEAEQASDPRWRIVTLVNAGRDDFVTGFLYAAVDEGGRLVLPVDENAVEIGGLRVESRFPAVALRGETRRLWLYGLIALVFATGLVARYWRLM